MKKIRDIVRFSGVVKSQREISRLTGVSRPAVSQYIRSIRKAELSPTELDGLSDSELLGRLESDAPAPESERLHKLKEQFPEYVKRLKKVGMTLQILWEEYKGEHSDPYSYSRFCEIFQEYRKDDPVSMHIEHKYGDRAFFDYAGQKLKIYDKETGEAREVQVFAGILGASQLTYVEAVESQKTPDTIAATENAFRYFGGTTAAVVFDCLKAVVTTGDRYEPKTNPQFDHFLEHYGPVNLPARPIHPRDKALVEGVIKIIYTRIYTEINKQKFFSLKDLNRAILDLLDKHNNTPLTNMGISRRDLFETNEKQTLHSLPLVRYEFRDFAKATVQINYHVFFSQDKHYYSVPFNLRRKKVRIIAGTNTVEIYQDGIRVATHFRKRAYGYTTKPEHMPSQHRFLNEMNPEKLMRWAEEKSPVIKDFVAALLKRKPYPEQAYKASIGVIELTKKYSVSRVADACRRSIHYNSISYQSVKEILRQGLDQHDDYSDEASPSLFPEHENIRGSDYYAGGSL